MDCEKVCRRCLKTKPIDDFYGHSRMSDGHLNICKACVKERVRTHRSENECVREQDRRRYADGKKATSLLRWRSQNVERMKAAKRASCAVGRAIRAGVLVRPSTCESCGQVAYCEAAHRDYSKPLDVRWLCRRCHRTWDQSKPKTRQAS